MLNFVRTKNYLFFRSNLCFMPEKKGIRSKKAITYHGRKGKPVIHETKEGKKYITVRAKGGGVKRLYYGSKYKENGETKRLKI